MSEEEIYTEDERKEFRVPENSFGNWKKLVLIFMTTFVVVVIFASIFFRGIFSNADVNIGENPVASMNQREDEENELNIRAQIDQRLKMIQNEEEMPGVSERGYETDEEIVERLRRDESKNKYSEDDSKTEEKETVEHKQVMEPVSIPIETPKTDLNTTSNTVSKIYIGQYSDMQKAVEMQANILNSGLNITPIVREVNGYYTLQVGVFANYESAKAVADQINNAGFSAKIVREVR
ncbi:SPOR domain-containing protein [bacterium]|nr:SPOR domain-containing protein [bacterium]